MGCRRVPPLKRAFQISKALVENQVGKKILGRDNELKYCGMEITKFLKKNLLWQKNGFAAKINRTVMMDSNLPQDLLQ